MNIYEPLIQTKKNSLKLLGIEYTTYEKLMEKEFDMTMPIQIQSTKL